MRFLARGPYMLWAAGRGVVSGQGLQLCLQARNLLLQLSSLSAQVPVCVGISAGLGSCLETVSLELLKGAVLAAELLRLSLGSGSQLVVVVRRHLDLHLLHVLLQPRLACGV